MKSENFETLATTFMSSTARTRRVEPSHKLWKPHGYQTRAKDFLLDTACAALFLDPGLGKTSIVLAAFDELREAGIARKMLVVAPLRVCQLVWRQEAAGWTQFRHLKFSLLHGRNKKAALRQDADVYLINPEGVQWLADQFFGRRLPFDTVVIDELTKFKNHRAKRSKRLRPFLKYVARRWGLTGSPAPNGYMDLFGQMLMLDDGRALGRYITHYRDRYFQPDYMGFNYTLQPGADKAIEKRIRDMVIRMDANDYLDMPELIDDPIEIELDPKSRKVYEDMKRDMLVAMPDGVVTAANAAAVYNKLSQMANGAVYYEDDGGPRKWAHVHDAKLDAIEDLLDDLNGQPLLLGYEFKHDLERLKERFDGKKLGERRIVFATLDGASEKKAIEIERRWNAGEIDVLACHPASVGHGLNFQRGGAHHIGWFSISWDYELWDQFIRRILRQGNTAKHIINHMFIVRDSIDEMKLASLDDKDFTQARFLNGLNDFLHDAGGPPAGRSAGPTKEEPMVKKLGRRTSRRDDEEVDETEEDEDDRPRRSWGKKSRDDDADERPRRRRFRRDDDDEDDDDEDDKEDEADQRKKIRDKIRSRKAASEADAEDDDEEEPASKRARKAFSKAVQKELDGDEDEGDAEDEKDVKPAPKKSPARTTRKKPAAKAEAGVATSLKGPVVEFDPAPDRRRDIVSLLVHKGPEFGLESAEDVIEEAKKLSAFIENG